MIVGVICGQRRIQSSRYEIGLQMNASSLSQTTYTSLVSADWNLKVICIRILTGVRTVISAARRGVEQTVSSDRGEGAAAGKLRCQVAPVSVAVGSGSGIRFCPAGGFIAHWQQLLTEIKKARATFDTSETQKDFGVCVIEYEQVQAR